MGGGAWLEIDEELTVEEMVGVAIVGSIRRWGQDGRRRSCQRERVCVRSCYSAEDAWLKGGGKVFVVVVDVS